MPKCCKLTGRVLSKTFCVLAAWNAISENKKPRIMHNDFILVALQMSIPNETSLKVAILEMYL